MKKITIKIICFLLFFTIANAETSPQPNYASLIKQGNYEEALKEIKKTIDEIYSKRVDDKRIPSGYITIKKDSTVKPLIQLYRNRKNKSFFIEKNKKISSLHYNAAFCLFKLNKYEKSLSNYVQALRFKEKVSPGDHKIFYGMAMVYQKMRQKKAYRDSLEQAFSLDSKNSLYAYMLGNNFFTTRYREKSIFYFNKYLAYETDKIDSNVYLKLSSLYEGVGKYLYSQKNLIKYLKKNKTNGNIHFALGVLCFKKTGNFDLALNSFQLAKKHLAKNELKKLSKISEYSGDIYRKSLEFESAISNYQECIAFMNQLYKKINSLKLKIDKNNRKIRKLKISLLQKEDPEKYERYQFLKKKKSSLYNSLEQIEYQWRLLHPGIVRWKIAQSYLSLKKYKEAIKYFEETIKFFYKPRESRKIIKKLKLKIIRGY